VQLSYFINVLKDVPEVGAVLIVLEARFLFITAEGDRGGQRQRIQYEGGKTGNENVREKRSCQAARP
jgi:hypothetical protein